MYEPLTTQTLKNTCSYAWHLKTYEWRTRGNVPVDLDSEEECSIAVAK